VTNDGPVIQWLGDISLNGCFAIHSTRWGYGITSERWRRNLGAVTCGLPIGNRLFGEMAG
jgi:hypothetical protein